MSRMRIDGFDGRRLESSALWRVSPQSVRPFRILDYLLNPEAESRDDAPDLP